MNYKSHVAEMGREPPVKPAMFTRFANTIVGSGDAMVRPAASDQYDFEGEFAFVIGKPARHIKAANAFDVIAGYTCFHDGSIRDWQNHTTQFLAGKNFPRTGAMGPWMTTRDEVPDPGRLVLQTRLNGETVQRAPISDLVFGIPELIEYITTAMELAPGDVIATGTPGGVGAGRKPQLWMKPGDQVEVEIDAIGILSNHIVAEE
jgi:2-keto-4-pentenoate hydratase/2-oxohepta-3-ene-1,7-dioic acid hydratase in catechol pathway